MPASWKWSKCPKCGGRLKLVSRAGGVYTIEHRHVVADRAGGVRTYECEKCKSRVLRV
jgi:uncharacterized protein with PIN domain